MGMTIKSADSGRTSNLSGAGVAKKDTNNIAVRMQKAKQEMQKKKKPLKYNPREISSQLLRSVKSRNASQVLVRAKSKVGVLERAKATGQYEDNEVRAAIAHAQRIVRCAELKVRNLKEEEQEKKKSDSDRSVKRQQKKAEVKRRVEKKKQELETKEAVQEMSQLQREKAERQVQQQKKRRHRSEELGKVTEADMKYLRDRIKDAKDSESNAGTRHDGVVLDLSSTAAGMSELKMAEHAMHLEERQIEQEVEMEMDMAMSAVSVTGADMGSIGTAGEAAVQAGGGESFDVTI